LIWRSTSSSARSLTRRRLSLAREHQTQWFTRKRSTGKERRFMKRNVEVHVQTARFGKVHVYKFNVQTGFNTTQCLFHK
jgi:hypothetical protein